MKNEGANNVWYTDQEQPDWVREPKVEYRIVSYRLSKGTTYELAVYSGEGAEEKALQRMRELLIGERDRKPQSHEYQLQKRTTTPWEAVEVATPTVHADCARKCKRSEFLSSCSDIGINCSWKTYVDSERAVEQAIIADSIRDCVRCNDREEPSPKRLECTCKAQCKVSSCLGLP